MIKHKRLLAVLICTVILSGCGASNSKKNDSEVSTGVPPAPSTSEKLQDNKTAIAPPNLDSVVGIKEYLIGEWVFNNGYLSDVSCKMSIDENLNVNLSFYDEYANQAEGDYTGQIKLDRIYANVKEAPDMLRIELQGAEYSRGDFFFLHRTIYDEKRVMSWFFADGDNCVFSILGPDGYEDVPNEIAFEKVSGEKSSLRPRKNDEFYAIFWGIGPKRESIWIDDARWTPPEEEDYATPYASEMTFYENDVAESVLYNIATDQVSDILGDDLFPGSIYFVKTDKQGNIIKFISAEYKRYLESGSDDPAIGDLIFEILKEADGVQEYLDMGMTMLFSGETSMIDGEEFYLVALGTDHEENFVQEVHYAVNTNTGEVYLDDIINDIWVKVK